MVSTFISPVIGKASELGVSLYEDFEPVGLGNSNSAEELEVVIRAAYRQVLGNAHVMESERLTIAESQLKNGEITVREFIRQIAKSELYRSLFFFNCPTLRAIELNFKHLLGRAPESHEEIVQHTHILDEYGFETEIDSYIDSEEYEENFGENTVPYYLGYKTQTGKNVAGFTHIFQILRGSCSSDRSTFTGTRSRLQKSLITNKPSPIIPLSTLPSSWKPTPAPTNVNRLLSKVLNLNNYQSVAPTPVVSSTALKEEVISPRASIWQGQYNALADSNPLELIPNSSPAELEIIIRAVYKQVLGNAHIMESERLNVPESQLKRGEISVREFVRQVAKSELYKSRFIDNCPRYRSHELNFKHLLGRAPDDYQETLYHSNILDRAGYETDIDSYIDSDEYQDAFGENIVPYYRGYKSQTGKRLLGYTNMFAMLPSVSTSDKAGKSGNQPRLARPLIYNNPDGNVPITNIEQLLAEALKPKFDFVVSTQAIPSSPSQALQQECQEQEKVIASLEQQLKELQSLATIGAAGLRKWQPYLTDVSSTSESASSFSTPNQGRSIFAQPGSYEELQQRSQAQQEKISSLKQQIAQSRSLATIGEARLNKWRGRIFS